MMSEEKRPTGRPTKEIDWKTVEQCLHAGCSGVQTAGYLGIHHQTLYDAVQREFGMTFTEYSAEKNAKGETMIALKQFQEAVGKGDRGLLIWLGKQRLGQKENKEFELSAKNMPMFEVKHWGTLPHPVPYQVKDESASK